MGILYEAYNFTKKEYTQVGKYAVNTKDWIESPLSNFYMYLIKRFWYHTDNVILIPDTNDSYYDLREIWKDITEEAVKEYNETAIENENHYHDGRIPLLLSIEEYQSKQEKKPLPSTGTIISETVEKKP